MGVIYLVNDNREGAMGVKYLVNDNMEGVIFLVSDNR